jgi:PhnB protein
MQLEPYLFFDGRCEEAIEFYKTALGAEVNMLMRFKDNPQPQAGSCGPSDGNKIMHASLRIGDSNVMASDGQCQGKMKFDGFAISIAVKDDARAQKVFNALAEGGKINMPLGKTFFSSSFGMVADRFGVHWMVIVQP